MTPLNYYVTGLWAVVNNAAVNFVGALEFSTMDMYKMIAEVNQFGVIRVTKAFLPQIRKSRGKKKHRQKTRFEII